MCALYRARVDNMRHWSDLWRDLRVGFLFITRFFARYLLANHTENSILIRKSYVYILWTMCEICYYNVDSIYSLKRGGDVGALYKNQRCIFIKDPFPFLLYFQQTRRKAATQSFRACSGWMVVSCTIERRYPYREASFFEFEMSIKIWRIEDVKK